MIRFRLVLLPLILALAACGQPPADKPTQSSPAPLLTAEEMAKVLMDNAKVWKFESKPGVSFKRIGIRFVEDGKTRDSMSVRPGDDPIVTKIIVVIQDVGQDKHLLKIYEEHASGSTIGSSDAWFSKPLTMSGATTQTEVKPIALGTMMLMGGWTEDPVSGKGYAIDEKAPCRIELVIE